jgi:hypothetical protein
MIDNQPISAAVATTLLMLLVPFTALAGLPEDDFASRCAAPGVIKCVGFDDPAQIAGPWDGPSGILAGDNTTPKLDGTTKASGNSALLFTIPSNTGPNSAGAYFTDFADDLSVQFGENQDFFIQWRQRFSHDFVWSTGGGYKRIIVGTGDVPQVVASSCSDLEVVVTTYETSRFPVMYDSCSGSTSHGPYDGFYEPFGQYDFKLENARPSPFCTYQQGTPPACFPPQGNCFEDFTDEWLTYQIEIQTGPRVADEFTNSHVRLWIARENGTSEAVIDWGPYNLTAGPPSDDERFGKVWLTPYQTNKDPSLSYPTAYTWYDELIISKQWIPDPGAPPSPTSSSSSSGVSSSGVSSSGSGVSSSSVSSSGVSTGGSTSASTSGSSRATSGSGGSGGAGSGAAGSGGAGRHAGGCAFAAAVPSRSFGGASVVALAALVVALRRGIQRKRTDGRRAHA